GLVTDVAGHREGGTSAFLYRCRYGSCRIRINVKAGDLRTGIRKQPTDGRTNATGAASDDCHLAIEPKHLFIERHIRPILTCAQARKDRRSLPLVPCGQWRNSRGRWVRRSTWRYAAAVRAIGPAAPWYCSVQCENEAQILPSAASLPAWRG